MSSFTDREDETDIAFRRGFHWGVFCGALVVTLIGAFMGGLLE